MNPQASMKAELLAAIPSLRAFAMSLSGNIDRADDLVQETLVKAWSNLGSFTEGTNMSAWLFTILRNLFYSEYRKRRREVADPEGQFAAKLASAPTQNSHMDFLDFNAALQELSRGPARGADPGGRFGHVLRGGGRHLRLRRRHHEEPRQPRPQPARPASRHGVGR